jgi:prepilin-type processing-associated H-X9-DG protein
MGSVRRLGLIRGAILAAAAALIAGCSGSAGGPSMAGNPGEQAQQACRNNLRELGTGLQMFAQDRSNAFPRATGYADAANQLNPYTHEGAMNCPVTGKPYAFNTAASGASVASMAAPAQLAVFKDSVPHPDGKLNITFADGHVKQFSSGDPQVARGSWR